MLSRAGLVKRVAVLSVAAVFVAAGCAHADKDVSIEPLVPAAGRVDPGLGPGTRALSSGPGYKASPRWSPGGDRIAFTIDGYVVDRPTDSEELRRWTTRDFIAEDSEWISEDTLMILGAASPSGKEENPNSLYRARADENPLELEQVEKEVSAIGPGRGVLISALGRGAFESGLALMRGNGDLRRLYSESIKGRVAAFSLSPDGDEAVLAVRPPGDLEVSGRTHSQDGLVTVWREREGSDAAFDRLRIEPAEIPIASHQRKPALESPATEGGDQNPPAWADRRNLLLDLL